MLIFSKSDRGLKRDENQDSVYTGFLSDNSAFAVVCDGMGGVGGGSLASSVAVEEIVSYINKSYTRRMSRDSVLSLMKNALTSANMRIYEKAKEDPEFDGMGTTAVILIVRNSFALICHVGDSRAYLISDKISQITRDHSVVQTLLENGKLTPDEAKSHPRKNIITRALGVEKEVLPDLTELHIEIGNTVLLCSDGLTNYVDESSIIKTFEDNDISEVAEKLVDIANANGGGDNITVVTVTL
ncbi:MAG: Stp1/IreP family PP2C-type Ser/Thr phosphatase [Clostridia bacterium]|nr:Stp1/IreP family PP2C-type Ser/Thr phosphatase [Clostridia bacterium]